MSKTKKRNIFILLTIEMFVIILFAMPFTSYAKVINPEIKGKVYNLDKSGHYEITSQNSGYVTKQDNTIGTLSVSGDMNKESVKYHYDIKNGQITFTYSINNEIYNNADTDWHISNDNSNRYCDRDLGSSINSGAIIVETSLDGKKWSLDKAVTDAFVKNSNRTEEFYSSLPIQLVNGCYYRITAIYQMERKLENKKLLMLEIENKEYKKCAEVYEIYAINSEEASKGSDADTTPKKELGERIKTPLDNGYYGEELIKADDPHYGWKLGQFYVNSYTRDVEEDDGTPVFIKNVGDTVTLWFNLSQDIDKLNCDTSIRIAEDKNGYDQNFEIPKMNFRRGTLIIQFTDHEGKKHDPVIYTNYLEACTKTGANTKVELFEEGDYEIALDYEIENSPRKIGSVKVIPTYTDYRIAFKFMIRNGNCMVFPFDLVTGKELSDNSTTTNGFRLDMAKSRYLNIDVTRKIVKNGTEDIRFNRPAKDGDEYTENGIYVFNVKNKYTGENTTKTIRVGD